MGEYDQAIADYSMEIKLRPNYAEVYYDRGTVYSEKGEYDQAITDYSKAIELLPTFTDAYVKRGLAYFRLDEFESAIQDYDEVLELEPSLTKVYATRGIMCLHIEEWESAKFDLIFARNLRVNIIAEFHKIYEGVADFEQRNDVQLPEDIVAMLR